MVELVQVALAASGIKDALQGCGQHSRWLKFSLRARRPRLISEGAASRSAGCYRLSGGCRSWVAGWMHLAASAHLILGRLLCWRSETRPGSDSRAVARVPAADRPACPAAHSCRGGHPHQGRTGRGQPGSRAGQPHSWLPAPVRGSPHQPPFPAGRRILYDLLGGTFRHRARGNPACRHDRDHVPELHPGSQAGDAPPARMPPRPSADATPSARPVPDRAGWPRTSAPASCASACQPCGCPRKGHGPAKLGKGGGGPAGGVQHGRYRNKCRSGQTRVDAPGR